MKKLSLPFSKLSLVALVVASSGFLSGCIPSLSSPANTPTPVTNTSTEKSGVTTVRGTLQLQGKNGLLKTATGTVALESYDVDFTPYSGKSVTVTGKYSGDTLFVSEITE